MVSVKPCMPISRARWSQAWMQLRHAWCPTNACGENGQRQPGFFFPTASSFQTCTHVPGAHTRACAAFPQPHPLNSSCCRSLFANTAPTCPSHELPPPMRSVAAAARSTRRFSSHSLRLGDLQLKSDVLLAPLERVSDVGFRRLCFRHGAALTWTEMIYCSDLARGKTASCDLIDTHDPSTLTGVQILVDRTTARDGWGVDCLRAALEALEAGAAGARPEWRNIRAIDLNFGCPDPAVSARGAGPAQLRRRSKVRRRSKRRRTCHHGV